MGGYALVLNTSFEPLNVVHWQRALQLLFHGKAEVLEESDRLIHSVKITMKVPAVLRLLEYIPLAKKGKMLRFSRENIFIRDKYQCQYCAKKPPHAHLTLDHVRPVSQGGKKSWENIVTSCRTCNQKKGGRTPAQAGLTLLQTPVEPKFLPKFSFSFGISNIPNQWLNYLSVSRKQSP